jgi:hypothetical protein
MAFYSGSKTNQNLVFGDKGEIGNSSFAYSEAATIASTENKITSSDNTNDDQFSYKAVAVGSGKIVVGAQNDDDNGSNSGSAYIFDLDGTQLAKITASDGAISDNFGSSVAVGNGRIVVGAPYDADNGFNSGSAYIFDLNGTQLYKITSSDGVSGDYFGYSVAVGNGRIVVGAYGDTDNGSGSGSAYIFDLDGIQLAKITASDGATTDYFGYSVAVGNGRIVVGAYGDDDNGSNSGSGYIFDLDGNQLAKITASDGAASDNFGRSVAVGSGRIVVGAEGDDDNGSDSGSAYIFDLDGTQLAKITASDGYFFGTSVAVGNGRIVVGSLADTYRGSVYIFDLDGTQLTKITASDRAISQYFGGDVAVGSGRIVVGAYGDGDNGAFSGAAYIYNTNEYYDDYVEKIADNRIGKYTKLTG